MGECLLCQLFPITKRNRRERTCSWSLCFRKNFLLGFVKILNMFYLIYELSRSHEDMSVKMVDHIVNQHHIDIDPQMIKRVKVSSLFLEENY